MALVKCHECGNEVSSIAQACPKCGAKVKKKGIGVWGGIIILILIGVIVKSLSGSGSNVVSASTNSAPANVKSPKEEAIEKLEIKKFTWHKGGFDGIMLINGQIQNSGTRAVKDIEITCEHHSNSGTKIDSNVRTLYEAIQPGKSFQMRDFNMGFIHTQATNTACEVTNLVLL